MPSDMHAKAFQATLPPPISSLSLPLFSSSCLHFWLQNLRSTHTYTYTYMYMHVRVHVAVRSGRVMTPASIMRSIRQACKAAHVLRISRLT